ncbi:hypothetical protein QBC35DRAFT_63282 [Podospora australis]|uniref:Uncharacterized protein n=1 Tax=Podospora australis TaxID=1536484 RepID=A0AAN7AKM7_9PEZI|nr:hypothetical protein QBC35DRAFT_63282 [Podospora australis]
MLTFIYLIASSHRSSHQACWVRDMPVGKQANQLPHGDTGSPRHANPLMIDDVSICWEPPDDREDRWMKMPYHYCTAHLSLSYISISSAWEMQQPTHTTRPRAPDTPLINTHITLYLCHTHTGTHVRHALLLTAPPSSSSLHAWVEWPHDKKLIPNRLLGLIALISFLGLCHAVQDGSSRSTAGRTAVKPVKWFWHAAQPSNSSLIAAACREKEREGFAHPRGKLAISALPHSVVADSQYLPVIRPTRTTTTCFTQTTGTCCLFVSLASLASLLRFVVEHASRFFLYNPHSFYRRYTGWADRVDAAHD